MPPRRPQLSPSKARCRCPPSPQHCPAAALRTRRPRQRNSPTGRAGTGACSGRSAASRPLKFRFSAEPPSFVSGTSPPPPGPGPAPPGRLQPGSLPTAAAGVRRGSLCPPRCSEGPVEPLLPPAEPGVSSSRPCSGLVARGHATPIPPATVGQFSLPSGTAAATGSEQAPRPAGAAPWGASHQREGKRMEGNTSYSIPQSKVGTRLSPHPLFQPGLS